MLAARPKQRPTWQSGSLSGLQIGANALDRRRARIASVPEIKDKSGISDHISTKSGGSNVTLAEKFFDLTKQMHWDFLTGTNRLGEMLIPNAFPTCLGRYLSLMRNQ
jgi:hypothetical protein